MLADHVEIQLLTTYTNNITVNGNLPCKFRKSQKYIIFKQRHSLEGPVVENAADKNVYVTIAGSLIPCIRRYLYILESTYP